MVPLNPEVPESNREQMGNNQETYYQTYTSDRPHGTIGVLSSAVCNAHNISSGGNICFFVFYTIMIMLWQITLAKQEGEGV